jgi:hypothetical protein
MGQTRNIRFIGVRVPENVVALIDELAKQETRTRGNMTLILLKEALAARGKHPKPTEHKK